MRRRRVLFVAVPLLVVVLVVGFGVARFLTTENREREAIVEVLRAEARGQDVTRHLTACGAACRAALARAEPRLRGPGEVEVVLLNSETAYTLGRQEGWTRVVWVRGAEGVPVVQCVRVRRQGGPLTERSVTLLRLTAPLADNEASC